MPVLDFERINRDNAKRCQIQNLPEQGTAKSNPSDKCEEFAFLKMVDSIALQQSLRDLDRGFVNFFQKRAAHKSGSANMGVSGLSYRA